MISHQASCDNDFTFKPRVELEPRLLDLGGDSKAFLQRVTLLLATIFDLFLSVAVGGKLLTLLPGSFSMAGVSCGKARQGKRAAPSSSAVVETHSAADDSSSDESSDDEEARGAEARSTSKDATPCFSKVLKEGTQVSHKAAENVHFVRNFIRGKLKKNEFKQFLADLYFLYSALEERLDEFRNNDLIKPIYFPVELRRLPALERDMEYWFGKDWRIKGLHHLCMTPCTAEYVERIQACDAEMLVAHAYTR